ncbi:MAG TPA: hypothetical protein VFH06_02355 [Candidatus Saccharimonadales bacterium]|nr:hypothetical protein [Candidatus Saccharimonadales bacterium]
MTQQRFSLEVVLTCIGFYKIDSNIPIMANEPTLVNLIAFMDREITSEEQLEMLTTRRVLVVSASTTGCFLARQFPELAKVTYPHEETDPNHYLPWLRELHARFGADLVVTSQEGAELTEDERYELLQVNQAWKDRYNL